MIRLYLRTLFHHAINTFSVISLLMGLLAFAFLQLDSVWNAVVISAFAFGSILIAGYFAWREAFNQIPKGADLSIVCDSIHFGSGSSRGGIPISPMHFKVTLDAINRGDETVVFRSLEITKFIMNTDILGQIPAKTELVKINMPHARGGFSIPYKIEGRQRLLNLVYIIEVELNVEEGIEFARRLGELSNYEIELTYSFEDMNRAIHRRTISIQESFEHYRKARIDDWSSNPHQEKLALEALKALRAISSSN